MNTLNTHRRRPCHISERGSSDSFHVWFYGGVFEVGGSNGAISGLTKFNRYVGKTMHEE